MPQKKNNPHHCDNYYIILILNTVANCYHNNKLMGIHSCLGDITPKLNKNNGIHVCAHYYQVENISLVNLKKVLDNYWLINST